jgi:hypothetical protein
MSPEPRPVAVVTGASSGIGAAFARLLAREGHDLVLVARSGAPMEAIAQEAEERHGIRAVVMPKDLSVADAGHAVADAIAERALEPSVLVNSAGFTQLAPFASSDGSVMTALLRVNIETLTQLTRRLVPGMIERRRGRVINLGSNAAFQPGPGMACYYASRADMHDARIVTRNRLATSEEVAEWGWREARKGRSYAVYGARWRAFAFGTRFMPRDLAARIAAGTNERD